MGDKLYVYSLGELMDSNDRDYFVESVSEQLILMFWTALATLTGVGIILAIAL